MFSIKKVWGIGKKYLNNPIKKLRFLLLAYMRKIWNLNFLTK